MSLRETLSNYWYAFQQELFPRLEATLAPLSPPMNSLSRANSCALKTCCPTCAAYRDAPQRSAALARAFLAKAVFDIPTTRALIERLRVDRTLYQLCGWSSGDRLPSEATFSRPLPSLPTAPWQAACTRPDCTLKDHLVGHISRDATAIEGREKPAPKDQTQPKRQRGRPRKGEERPKAAATAVDHDTA